MRAVIVGGWLAGQVLAFGQLSKTVDVSAGGPKYETFSIPEAGSSLELRITTSGSDYVIDSIDVQAQDGSDTVQWIAASPTDACVTTPPSTPTLYKTHIFQAVSAPVFSSREWVWINGTVKPCNPTGSGGEGPVASTPFDVDVPGPDIDIENLAEENEESVGGFVCVGTDCLVKVTINKVEPSSRHSGTVTLTGIGIGTTIKLWENSDRTGPVASGATFSTPSSLPKDIWIEGIAASGALRDVELKVSYTTPQGQSTEDKVKLTTIPVEVRIADRDDPTMLWSDNVIAAGLPPVYAGSSCGDMVSWRLGGVASTIGASFSWSATGPENRTGPSGVGKNEWRISDGDTDTTRDWIDWKSGIYSMNVTINFASGGIGVLTFKQDVGTRTEQYFAVGTIPTEVEDVTGVDPRIVEQWACPNIIYSILAAVGGGINDPASNLHIPMDEANRVYVNHRILNSTRNLDPEPHIMPELDLSQACGLDPYKHYRWFGGCQFKYRVAAGALLSAPLVVSGNSIHMVGFTPIPCSQSNFAGVIGQEHGDSGDVTVEAGGSEFSFLLKFRAGNSAQVGWNNLNGRKLPWTFIRLRFSTGDGLLHTRFADGASLDPEGPDMKDFSLVPTIIVFRRFFDLSTDEWRVEKVRKLDEQRRPFFSIGAPIPGSPYTLP